MYPADILHLTCVPWVLIHFDLLLAPNSIHCVEQYDKMHINIVLSSYLTTALYYLYYNISLTISDNSIWNNPGTSENCNSTWAVVKIHPKDVWWSLMVLIIYNYNIIYFVILNMPSKFVCWNVMLITVVLFYNIHIFGFLYTYYCKLMFISPFQNIPKFT